FGTRAMQELDKLNTHPGTATSAMALSLAINTASITLLPPTVIALRAAAGSVDPAGILPTTLSASVCGTIAAIATALMARRFFPLGPPDPIAGRIDRPWTREASPGASPASLSPGRAAHSE